MTAVLGSFIIFFTPTTAVLFAQEAPPPNLKIAFIGDQGLGQNAVAVLNLIKAEGAQAVMHSGDLDYTDNPAAWEAQINSVLGANFPFFVSIGNHDELAWNGPNGYQQYLESRFNRLGIKWSGRLGVRSTFFYKGIFFVVTAPGITSGFDDGGSDIYIRDQLAADNSAWSICSWHKNMRLMQVGGKTDETGWAVYEEARKGGAIIATAHEHSYSRTHLLSSMVNQTVASTSNTLTLTKGNSFAFVSGLGGHSVRAQSLTGNWWASISASTCLQGDQICQPNASPGALFGVFNVDGQPNKALFYFKDINGKVVDSFVVISEVAPLISGITPSITEAGGGDFILTVDGAGFINGSVVRWNNVGRPTTFVSQTRLTANISASDIAAAGTPQITVVNPAPGGAASNSVTLTVTNPTPVIAGLAPSPTLVGGGPLALTVNGTGFNASSVVRFANSNRATTFVSPTQLTVHLTAEDLSAAGFFALTVVNTAPGGGTSGEATLSVNNPAPTLTTLSPQQATAGGKDFTLVVDGTGFISGSVVRWNGSDRPTAFVSQTRLTVLITHTDINAPGSFDVAVINPVPGGGSSNVKSFKVEAPPPKLLTEEGTGRALALDSVTWMREPFLVLTPYDYGSDKRTRVMLFVIDLDLTSTENSPVVTAQAEDSQNRVYPLAVEYVGKVPGFEWLTQVIVKLPDELGSVGEVQVSINVRGVSSNKAPLSVRPPASGSP